MLTGIIYLFQIFTGAWAQVPAPVNMNSCITVEQPIPLQIDPSPVLATPNVSFGECLEAQTRGLLAQAAGNASDLTKVGGGLLAGLTDLVADEDLDDDKMLSKLLGGVGANAPLCDNVNGATVDEASCTELKNEASFKRLMGINRQTLEGSACQLNKLLSLNSELACLQSQAEQMRAYSTKVGEVFQAINNQVKQRMGQLDTDAQNCAAQQGDLKTKGDELAAAAQAGEAAMAAIAGATTAALGTPNAIFAELDYAKRAEAQWPEVVQRQTANLARQCLERPNPNYSCTGAGGQEINFTTGQVEAAGGTTQSGGATLAEYVHCVVMREAAYQKDASGRYRVRNVDLTGSLARGRSVANTWKKFITDQLIGRMPDKSAVPTTPNPFPGGQGLPQGEVSPNLTPTSPDILRPEDMLKYGPVELSGKKYNETVPIFAFVKKQVSRCFEEATAKVKEEIGKGGNKNSTSGLSRYKFELEQIRQQSQGRADELIRNVNSTYQMLQQKLHETNLPLQALANIGIPNGLASCGASYDSRKDCIQRFKSGINGLLEGTTQNKDGTPDKPGLSSGVILTVKGSVSNRFVSCRGIKGCIQEFMNQDRLIRSQMAKNASVKGFAMKSYNAQIDEFGKGLMNGQLKTPMGQVIQFSPFGGLQQMASQLTNYVGSINRVLQAQLGLDGIDIEQLEGERLEDRDRDGVLDPPDNALKYLASMVPIFDVNTAMKEATRTIKSQKGDIEEKLKEAKQAIAKLGRAANECLEDEKKDDIDPAYENVVEALGYCESEKESLNELMAEWGRITKDLGLSPAKLDSLVSGKADDKVTEADAEIDVALNDCGEFGNRRGSGSSAICDCTEAKGDTQATECKRARSKLAGAQTKLVKATKERESSCSRAKGQFEQLKESIKGFESRSKAVRKLAAPGRSDDDKTSDDDE